MQRVVPGALRATKGWQAPETASGAVPRLFREQAILDARKGWEAKRVLGVDGLKEVERPTKREVARPMAKCSGGHRTSAPRGMALNGWANTGRRVCASQVRQPGVCEPGSHVFGKSVRQPQGYVGERASKPRNVARREARHVKTYCGSGEGDSVFPVEWCRDGEEVQRRTNYDLRRSQSQNLESHLRRKLK